MLVGLSTGVSSPMAFFMQIFSMSPINMFCLGLWGAHLERRVGSFYLFSIYICALISGAFFGVLTLPPQHLLIGASGAISGILGALLCLWVLGRIDLPASFFVINIGLNVAVLALNTSNIGWGSHLGGFAAGIISCALLDVLEKVNALVFRCKFPEFIKINGFVLVIGFAVLFWGELPIAVAFRPEGWLLLFTLAIVSFGVIKLIDLILSIKKGLAIIVIVFAAANAALVLFAGVTYTTALSATCSSRKFSAMFLENALNSAVCKYKSHTLYRRCLCICLNTSWLFTRVFSRHNRCWICRCYATCRTQTSPRNLSLASRRAIFLL